MNDPTIAVTMGDAAGIGPEVIVRAFTDPEVCHLGKCVVLGDAARLRLAARVTGAPVTIEPVPDPSEVSVRTGVVPVLDVHRVPDELVFGELSASAGHAAYEYVRRASELAMSGAVQAVCTAPLNKAALHAAGHRYPGHTELLAELCGVDEVSMMLSTGTETGALRVLHVTTHIGLTDAVERIDAALVRRTIQRGYRTLVDSGVPEPVIAVCGINPHAGENGLFGQGEEETKVEPALRACQAEGIDARGPLPADTVFFRAGRGDFDLVVAMYHDQGHGPVKVLGLEAGVNVTVGLPVIRTSVDHGTAFDIAGTGQADAGSMLEALRQASALAQRP